MQRTVHVRVIVVLFVARVCMKISVTYINDIYRDIIMIFSCKNIMISSNINIITFFTIYLGYCHIFYVTVSWWIQQQRRNRKRSKKTK